jgi:hypothetical protein
MTRRGSRSANALGRSMGSGSERSDPRRRDSRTRHRWRKCGGGERQSLRVPRPIPGRLLHMDQGLSTRASRTSCLDLGLRNEPLGRSYPAINICVWVMRSEPLTRLGRDLSIHDLSSPNADPERRRGSVCTARARSTLRSRDQECITGDLPSTERQNSILAHPGGRTRQTASRRPDRLRRRERQTTLA